MFQVASRLTDPERGDDIRAVTDDHPKKPQPELPQPPQLEEEFDLGDSSSRTIFSMYSKIAVEEDNKMAERWQKDADGILIFTGLFSTSVAAFLAMSVQDLRPNSQDTSAFYLANIYQILADPTLPQTSIPFPVGKPPPFSPPRHAVWVNSLWFLSLVVSLSCAFLATSLQQWARRYLRVTQPARCSPEKQARTRAFFAGGVDKMHIPWVVESLPALLHLSLFLFLSGLVVFLHNVNHSVYLSVLLCVGLFVTAYGWVTFMPVLWPESPYYTPLSKPAVSILYALFLIVVLVFFIVFYGVLPFLTALLVLYTLSLRFVSICISIFPAARLGVRHRVTSRSDSNAYSNVILTWLCRHCEEAWRQYKRFSVRGPTYVTLRVFMPCIAWLIRRWWIEEAIEDANMSKIDMGILDWSVVALGEDEALEKFFEAIPGFLNSQKVNDVKRHLADRSKFVKSFAGFLGRTLSSNQVSEEVKTRRLEICMNAANKLCNSQDIYDILHHLSHFRLDQVPQSIQTAQILALWPTGGDRHISEGRREIVACILPHVRKRDDSWIALARDQFGLEDGVLRNSIAHDDNSVLLAILLHAIRNRATLVSGEILSSLSRFDILDTNPALRNEFCALWNKLVRKAKSSAGRSSTIDVLHRIRHLYISLHQGTDASPTLFSASTRDLDPVLDLSSSYPLCKIVAHHPNPTTPPNGRDDLHDASLRPSRPEGQPVPGGSTSLQQT